MRQNQINKSWVRTTGPFQNPENSSESIHLLAFIHWSLPGTQKRLRKQYSSPRIHLTSVSIHNIVYIRLYCYFMTNVWHLRKMMRSNKLLSRETCRHRAGPERDTKMTQNFFFLISKFSHLLYFLIRKSQIFLLTMIMFYRIVIGTQM